MKFSVGLLTLTMALVLSATAGFFSVVGLGHLFAGAFWPVIFMGSALETAKIVTAGWLHANWENPRASKKLKGYLTAAVLVLMTITALGIYGFLAKGHLEQEAPLAGITLQIKQIQTQIDQKTAERDSLTERLTQLDQTVATLMSTAKTSKDAQTAERMRFAQRKDRVATQANISKLNAEINTLAQTMVPLKLQTADVDAKLGPIKYVAQLFGWHDPARAVQMVILLLMFAFDPLAITLIIAASLTISEASEDRLRRRSTRALEINPESEAFKQLEDAYENGERVSTKDMSDDEFKALLGVTPEEPAAPAEPPKLTGPIPVLTFAEEPPPPNPMLTLLEEENRRLKEKLDTPDPRVENLEGEIETLRIELAQAQTMGEENARLNVQIENLLRVYETERNNLKQAINDRHMVAAERDAAAKQLADLEEEAVMLRQFRVENDATVIQQQDQIDMLAHTLNGLKTEHDDLLIAHREAKQIADTHAATLAANEALKAENRRLQSKLDSLAAEKKIDPDA